MFCIEAHPPKDFAVDERLLSDMAPLIGTLRNGCSGKVFVRSRYAEEKCKSYAEAHGGRADLLDRMQDGYELETDSLGGNPVLRRLKDGEVIRPLFANANTVKALQNR
jgi:hypothetical protein